MEKENDNLIKYMEENANELWKLLDHKSQVEDEMQDIIDERDKLPYEFSVSQEDQELYNRVKSERNGK